MAGGMPHLFAIKEEIEEEVIDDDFLPKMTKDLKASATNEFATSSNGWLKLHWHFWAPHLFFIIP